MGRPHKGRAVTSGCGRRHATPPAPRPRSRLLRHRLRAHDSEEIIFFGTRIRIRTYSEPKKVAGKEGTVPLKNEKIDSLDFPDELIRCNLFSTDTVCSPPVPFIKGRPVRGPQYRP
ncbi:hypothetical protein EVAR_61838_1 [Eumeta japonica]|uniref:Uncharacterized protein n=1 Tax=Eumeta variegata TaxID=151549 RepID=A0A4C1YWR3_EUMVA|nr:hypothetical protein EVAR_61838_1 [Eumeta japonica]